MTHGEFAYNAAHRWLRMQARDYYGVFYPVRAKNELAACSNEGLADSMNSPVYSANEIVSAFVRLRREYKQGLFD